MAVTLVLFVISILLFGYSFLRYRFLWQRGRIPNVFYYVFQVVLLGTLFVCFFFSQYITNDYLLWGVQLCCDIYLAVMLITPVFSFLRGAVRMLGKRRKWNNRIYRFFNHPTKISWIVLVITAVFGVFVFVYSQIPQVSEQTVMSKKSANIDKFSVVSVSDLHIGQHMAYKEVQAFFEKLENLQPDIVVFTGNFFSPDATSSMREFTGGQLKRLLAKMPVYLVEGPNECGETAENIEAIRKIGVRFLEDEMIELSEGIQFAAVRNRKDDKRKDVAYTLSLLDKSKPAIVCSYEDLSKEERQIADFDLFLQASANKKSWILPRQIQLTKMRFS